MSRAVLSNIALAHIAIGCALVMGCGGSSNSENNGENPALPGSGPATPGNGDVTNTNPNGTDPIDQVEVDPYPEFCTITGLDTMVNPQVRDRDGYFEFSAVTSETGLHDRLVIQNYQSAPYNGPTEPGTYPVGAVGYEDCGLCPLLYKDCDANGCDRTFYAAGGSVRIDTFGDDEHDFKAELVDVWFQEVEISSSFVSTPVFGGDKWCTHGSDELSRVHVPTSEVCVPDGTGMEVEDNIRDLKFSNCAGETISLHDDCGQADAVWMIASAGWCPACAQWVPYAMEQDGTINGLKTFIVLGEDQNYNSPTAAYCDNYARQYGIPADQIILDPNWDQLWGGIEPYIGSTVGLPWNAVLDGENMQYVACDTCGTGDVVDTLNELLQ